MDLKQTALLTAALWIAFWLAGIGGGFFGFASPQGLAGSGVFFGLMAIALVWVQKKFKDSDIS